MVSAVQQFLSNGKLLRSWNATTITLVPKVSCPSNPGDFRPISCCHTLYKCISKLICSGLKRVLGGIICQTQGAFVQGRNISHKHSPMPGSSEALFEKKLLSELLDQS
ncbi:uncharacterized protein LOC130818561 [Amaranthus tricolor]|uniref:uncharacterized protein LOC130818561 n=1 Tax=Amaranthus tricolor TaxID=29722 RepID=UPI0025829176|nr:uncharacterized protein LOC130818561 [Amaranthus tricolor]